MVRIVVLVCAGAGALAMSIGSYVSYAFAAGTIPAFLYTDADSRLTTLLQWRRMPLEFPGVLLFGLIAAAAYMQEPRKRIRVDCWIVVISILALGYTAWLLLTKPNVIPTAIAVVLALVILLSVASQVRTVSAFVRDLALDVRWAATTPAARAATASLLALFVLSPMAFSAALSGISSTDARIRAYWNWYFAQVPFDHPIMRRADRIRVVVLADYQCQECPPALTIADNAIEDVRSELSMPVDLIVRHFPLERECNDAADIDTHPLACDAAAAVALIQERYGADAASRSGRRLARLGMRMTRSTLEDYLAERRLREEYRGRLPELLQRVRAEAAGVRGVRITSLPAVFVDGVRLLGHGRSAIQEAVMAQAARRTGRR